jgi:hypothetical protein
MAATPRWTPFFIPKTDISDARGCEILEGGQLNWIFIPHGGQRWVALSQRFAKLTDRRKILEIEPRKTSARGVYPVKITAKGVGYTVIDADKSSLGVLVMPRRTVRIAFRNVVNESFWADWKGAADVRRIKRMLSTANRLFRLQGNIGFSFHGDLAKAQAKNKIAAVSTDFWLDPVASDFDEHTVKGPHLTTFFVKETGDDAWAAQRRKVIIMDEKSIKSRHFDLVFAHELGHYLGLGHPFDGHNQQNELAPMSNLMNQSKLAKSYGGRDADASYLTRDQIEHVCDPQNWGGGKKKFTCFV